MPAGNPRRPWRDSLQPANNNATVYDARLTLTERTMRGAFLGFCYIAFVLLCIVCGGDEFASAQDYPSKPIRIIVPYPPGGFNDTLARTLGHRLTQKWGQPVIVDNRPGAGSTIGTNLAAKAPADGYTLLIASFAFA